MKIKESGKLIEYETLPKRKLYIGVYKLGGGGYFSSSSENKQELILNLQRMNCTDEVRIYTVEVE